MSESRIEKEPEKEFESLTNYVAKALFWDLNENSPIKPTTLTLTKPISPKISKANGKNKLESTEDFILWEIEKDQFKPLPLNKAILEGKYVIAHEKPAFKEPEFDEFDFSHSAKFLNKTKSRLTSEEIEYEKHCKTKFWA